MYDCNKCQYINMTEHMQNIMEYYGRWQED